MKKSFIFIVILMIIIIAPMSCISRTGESPIIATTDAQGIASLNIDGSKITVRTMDGEQPTKSLSDIKVSAVTHEVTGIIYAIDDTNTYFSQLTILNSGFSNAKMTYLPMYEVGDAEFMISQPMSINLKPNRLKKLTSLPYSDLGSYVESSYPQVNGLLFITSEEMADIKNYMVTLYASPFSDVLYAHIQEKINTSGLEIVPPVYADPTNQAMWVAFTHLITEVFLYLQNRQLDSSDGDKPTCYSKDKNGNYQPVSGGKKDEPVKIFVSPVFELNPEDLQSSTSTQETTGSGDAPGSSGSGTGGGCSDGH